MSVDKKIGGKAPEDKRKLDCKVTLTAAAFKQSAKTAKKRKAKA